MKINDFVKKDGSIYFVFNITNGRNRQGRYGTKFESNIKNYYLCNIDTGDIKIIHQGSLDDYMKVENMELEDVDIRDLVLKVVKSDFWDRIDDEGRIE